MITVNLSAGAILVLGICAGVIVGVVGLATIAVLHNKSKRR